MTDTPAKAATAIAKTIAPPIDAGLLLNDRMSRELEAAGFQVLGELGRGGMGVVYRATDRASGRTVALKVLPLDREGTSILEKRFDLESELGRYMNHPDIIQIHGAGRTEHAAWISMELLSGSDLSAAIDDPNFSIEERAQVLLRTALALHYVHEHRVIHRDVKPSNIYLTASGGVKLLDFGVAKLADLTLTATGQLCGTPAYMAPEQLRSAEVSPATDVFALGVVAYRVYSGAMPWNGESLHSLMMAICVSPPRPFREAARANDRFGLGEERIEMLHAIIHRAIEAEPSRRFSSAFELAGAFEDFLLGRTDHPTLAPQAGPSRWSNQQIEWARARAARVELDQTGETADLADRSTTANVIDREDRGWPKMYVALLVVFGLALILVSWLLIAGG